ncbi:hypothetical protein [Winogradskyella damuponensis]|uniref:Uncharacterized protein n=1 Tax=Winogradskyella damuponensis TaxID=943939 RepID=A0ABP8D414_9FLAO
MGIPIVLYQCQKFDDSQTIIAEEKPPLKISIVHGNAHFAKANPDIYNKLKNANQNHIAARGTEYSTDYNFYFNLDNIQIIEKNTYTQYTVVVENESQNNNLLNYVLIVYNDGEERQYLVTYPRIETAEGLEIDHYSATLQSLDGQSLLGRGTLAPCTNGTVPQLIDVTPTYSCTAVNCGGQNHGPEDEGCKCGTIENGYYHDCTRASYDCGWTNVNTWSCTGSSSSGGPDSGGETGGGDTDDDDDDNDDDESIGTIALDDDAITHLNNCNELKKLTDDNVIKNKLNLLKADAKNKYLKNEKGFSLRKNANNETYSTPIITADIGSISYRPLINLFGVAHLHQLVGSNPMFSAMDAFALNSYNNAFDHNNGNTDESLPVYILVVATGTYAIKINDLAAINAYGDEFPTLKKQLKEHKRFNEKYNKHYNPITGATGDFIDYEKIFTKYIQSKGISLYKANNELSTWERLEHDSNATNEIKKTNCN